MLAMYDQKYSALSQKLDTYLIFDHEEKISPKRRMIPIGNIQTESHEDGLLKWYTAGSTTSVRYESDTKRRARITSLFFIWLRQLSVLGS
jgi:hypothetical protein